MPTSKLQVHELVSESEKHALSKGFRGAPECLKSGINLPVAYLLPIFFQCFRLTLKKTNKNIVAHRTVNLSFEGSHTEVFEKINVNVKEVKRDGILGGYSLHILQPPRGGGVLCKLRSELRK